MTYSALGEMSSATHECAGSNMGWGVGQSGSWGEIQGALDHKPWASGGLKVILRPRHREEQPCSGESFSRSTGSAPGPQSHSTATEALQALGALPSCHRPFQLSSPIMLPGGSCGYCHSPALCHSPQCSQAELSMPSLPMALSTRTVL